MTPAECLAFMAEGAPTGILATVRADGSPHAAPVWFLVEAGGTIILNTGSGTAKGRNLRRDGRAALVVDDPAPPFSFARVDGEVELSEHADELLDAATRIAARYMGPERADEYGRRNGVPGELLVRIHPTRITGTRGVAD
ncbi:MAG: PPOX class F420-dependent oxidoreductase [Miltoncostaeaceae bacterium]